MERITLLCLLVALIGTSVVETVSKSIPDEKQESLQPSSPQEVSLEGKPDILAIGAEPSIEPEEDSLKSKNIQKRSQRIPSFLISLLI